MSRVDLVEPSTNSLTYRVTTLGRRKAGSMVFSTLLMGRVLTQRFPFSAMSAIFSKIYLING